MCYEDKPPLQSFFKRYRPDVGLLTSEPAKRDVELNPHIIAPDPLASDDCLDVFSSDYQLLQTSIEDENTMNTGEDELSSGLNGRLRPRKSTVPSPQNNKILRKTENKNAQDKPKQKSTPSKASSTKADDLANKSDLSTALQLLCSYCDKKFASKQALSKHVRRIHLSSSKQDLLFECLFCNHAAADTNDIIRHMVDSHPNQYFACLDCHARFQSTSELAEHKLNVCEKQKMSYRSKLRQKVSTVMKKNEKFLNINDKEFRNDNKEYSDGHRFNGIVISCELKPSEVTDEADIEDNIPTNLILPPSKSLGTNAVIEKNAVIVLDDIQWNKRMPTNFSFHNTDADQILSRLGVVHRSPRTGESTKRDWFKNIDESTQKFEKCFDTGFYSKVASNVQENLSKFLDGSFNFNPDADSTIKTRKLKNSVVINTAEGFPILLACEQYSRNLFDSYLPRTIAPKHKWKWENDKNPVNPDDIKRDSHVNNCIITLVSSLDIWTQLCMRRKFEDKFSIAPLEKKTEKQNAISKELKEILESREIPSTSSNIVKLNNKVLPSSDNIDFPASLGLKPSVSTYDIPPAVLSGEWVRPRCYVCCACGAQTRDSRGLSSHISTEHPNAHVQHYEIVGEFLLNADILKHLYVPPSQLYNRTRPLRGIRECTKCKKPISLEDLHQHMLDCAGDTPTVRRKCRYRPFGVRRRRPRLPDNTIRKKIRKDIRRQTRQKNHIRPRPKIRSEVGDAETIRKMLADLPAKRHRVMVTPINSVLRPRKKLDKQRNTLMMKRRPNEVSKTRQQRDNNRNTNINLSGAITEDSQDNLNLDNDDDDDKPLKTRIKRVISSSTRQKELMKRKVSLNRVRRSHFKEQAATPEKSKQSPAKATTSLSDVPIEQLSVGNTPERIDVNNSPYKTRENSNRKRSNNSNNNNDQRQGSNGQNGNTNNTFIPVQNNVPLKHSIARLTADTDTHEKSRFHHMFLLQQGCNNANEHEADGSRPMFENEAIVTKLDKPPLHFQPRGMLDPLSCNKNKSNKARKGLNDCIAMLKNKLEEPFPDVRTAQSVGSASDEPLICESATTERIPATMECQNDDNTKPAEVFSRHQYIQERLIEINTQNQEIREKIADFPLQYIPDENQFELISQDRSDVQPNIQNLDIQQNIIEPPSGSEATKRDVHHKKLELPPEIQIIPQKTNESYPVDVTMTMPSHMISHIVMSDPNIDPHKFESYEPMGQSFLSNIHMHEQIVENDATHVNSLQIRKSPSVITESNLIGVKQADIYMNSPPTEHKQSNVYIERDCNECIQDNFPDREIPRIIQHEIYTENDFNKIVTNAPQQSLVHTDTNTSNLEITLAAPLDLSVNITETSESSKQTSSYDISDYESYETLDLSNKSCDMRDGVLIEDINNTIVDLRIKSTLNANLELEEKNGDLEIATDLTIKSLEIDNFPTDLSIKRINTNNSYSYESLDMNYDCVQDLSRHNKNIEDICGQVVLVTGDVDQEAPTDLSGKQNASVSPLIPSNNYNETVCTIDEIKDTRSSDSIGNRENEVQNEHQVEEEDKCSEQYTDDFNVNPHYGSTKYEKYKEKDLQLCVTQDSHRPLNHEYENSLVPENGTLIQNNFNTEPPNNIVTMTTLAFDGVQPFDSNKNPSLIDVNTTPHTLVEVSSGEQTDITNRRSVSVPLCSLSGPIPLYTLSNPLPNSKIRQECTTPVYTLANACISMAKVEPCKTLPSDETILCIPKTTVTNVPVYTDTSVNSQSCVSHCNSHSSSSALINISDTQKGSVMCSASSIHVHSVNNLISTNTMQLNTDFHSSRRENSTKDVDLDPETAKKIALLPKELVEILGTMPVDHRNQLLNVLPQYVSKSPTIQHKEAPNIPVTTHTLAETALPPSTALTQTLSLENETKPLVCFENTSEPASLGVNKNNVVTFKKPVSDIDPNRIIDLTDDDNVIKAPEEFKSSVTIQIEPPSNKANKIKVKDQTASLRAVRIKAPSERKKSVCSENNLLKTPIVEHNTKDTSVENKPDVIDDFTEISMTLAIQQAEVSSTQHNTTGSRNSKYPMAISPASTESSSDESSKNNTQKNPVVMSDIATKQSPEGVYDIPLPKSIVVSSSFATNNTGEFHVVNNISAINPQKPLERTGKDKLLSITNKDTCSSDIEFQKLLTLETSNPPVVQIVDLVQQEDSEDDISLATIVKQKQRDLKSNENLEGNLQNTDINRKKKKDKKSKKSYKKGSQNMLSDVSTPGDARDGASTVYNPISLEGKDKFIAVENENKIATYGCLPKTLKGIGDLDKHSIKKIKKGHRYQKTVENNSKTPTEEVKDESNNDKITIESDFHTDIAYNDEKFTVNITNQTDEKQAQPNCSGANREEEIKSASAVKKFKENIEIAGNVLVKLNKIDEIFKSDLEDGLKKDKDNNKIENVEKDETKFMQTEGKFSGPENKQSIDNVTTLNDTAVDGIIDKEKSSITMPSKDKKYVGSKKVKTIDVDTPSEDNDLLQESHRKDNIVTPLRRSRRGKSLFMESTSIERDILNCSEILVEHKTPLTKKQLIFSKLLLDEAKPNQPAHSTPEKQETKEEIQLPNTIENTTNISRADISSISNTEFVTTFDKNKGIKRRTSPPNIKKSKKKKCVNDHQNNADDIVNDDVFVNSEVVTNVASMPSISKISLLNNNKQITKRSEYYDDIVRVKNSISDVKDTTSYEGTPIISPEKRKMNDQILLDQSSKPKKIKTHDDSFYINNANDKKTNKTDIKANTISVQVSETRTACYNLPIPTKRGRSKSVVVKSSASDLYDPYDIDLEDMIEQHESFRSKDKNSDYVPKQRKGKINSATSKQNIKTSKEKDKPNLVNSAFHENNVSTDKPGLSDSDESSKSDTPLQKYVEEKEKKSLECDIKPSKDRRANVFISFNKLDNPARSSDNKTKPTSGDKNKKAQNEAEQELRSEQFMESFGFFCERKHRKSNLLATKKISETFHINNESDDMYFGFKQRSSKKSLQIESKKSIENETSKIPQPSTSKKAAKRGRKKKSTKTLPSYCGVCKKEFRRPDNYLRHQMTLLHISKLSEVEMKIKTAPVHEEPNYLVAYKQYLERFKKLTDKLAKLKKKNPKAAAKVVLPTMKEILSDVNRTVREQQLSQRGLSSDEELFIDCCELLKDSHRGVAGTSNGSSSASGLDLLEKAINEYFFKDCESDDDVDSITAQNILESEEVRNLENDLISGLKEAANASRKSNNMDYQSSIDQVVLVQPAPNDLNVTFPNANISDAQYQGIENLDIPEKSKSAKAKKYSISKEVIQVKEKMYPDIIEDIDMFEDKFDKIKRKCRSQAAAAKHVPPIIDQSASNKARRKAEKKKGKRNSKKTRHQSTQVPTKGALKGFDGIKVSIPTSDINYSALPGAPESSPKKKKKASSKKKRDKKDSESSSKNDSDHHNKEGASTHNKKVDVYEFMDNEDAELFEFRPSTLMERFKSISNKDMPSTSKFNPVAEENSSESGSDGDDFVYMSDDYVCSDDETENSLLSCENGNVKVGHEAKKNLSPQKRKDVVEKNAVMGKIFKHNAVRTEKKIPIPKEPTKPKANLDQLFDSLLEEEPSTSMLNRESLSPKNEDKLHSLSKTSLFKSSNHRLDDDKFTPPQSSLSSQKYEKVPSPNLKQRSSISNDYTNSKRHDILTKKYDINDVNFGASTSKTFDSSLISPFIDYGPSTSKKYDTLSPKEHKESLQNKNETISLKKNEEIKSQHYETKIHEHDEQMLSKTDDSSKPYEDSNSPEKKTDEGIGTSYEYGADVGDSSTFEDDTGVARQRARRKCTVGKQNVLAESWSSESEPDGGPPRPNSAESDIAGTGRKKKGKKKDSQQAGARRTNSRQVTYKKQENESRVNSNNRNPSGSGSGNGYNGGVEDPGEGTSAGPSGSQSSSMTTEAEAAAAAAAAMPAPSTTQGAPGSASQKGRTRSVAYYWSSEGDDEQEHQQQHGWIVGDSHKKLVTMLAHAKGRKRNNDDKRHLVE